METEAGQTQAPVATQPASIKSSNKGKGFVKLIDIHDQAERLHRALRAFLGRHGIEYREQKFFLDGFIRFRVQQRDLCCAQSVLPALRELAARK